MYKTFKITLLLLFGFFSLHPSAISSENKIKIGLLVPITGDNKELGQQIIKSTRVALKDINTKKIEIYLKDTNSNPNQTIKSAIEFREMGIKIVIGPVFYKSLTYLDEIQEIIFLSLTNKTLNLPSNVISAGVNATSQLNAIKKFIELNEIKKTILLTPKLDCCGVVGSRRSLILELAMSLKMEALESNISINQAQKADEVFISNSVIGIQPVHSIESYKLGQNPLTEKIQKAFLSKTKEISSWTCP